MSNLVSSNEPNFKPTYLYIKQHSITKKLYFGKTISKDPVKYKGSGKRWKRHIKTHGVDHVETLWYCLFYNKESIREFALMCSKMWNIIDSDVWLNLMEEDGVSGGSHSKETIETISRKMKGKHGKPCSIETREKISLSKKGKHRKPFSKETREKLSLAHKGRLKPIVSCPHCGRSGSISPMKQWHFDKCKHKSTEPLR